MANVDGGLIMQLAPKSWRPFLAFGTLCAAAVIAYFTFVAGPIAANAEGVKKNRDAMASQQQLNSQLLSRLNSIEAHQATTEQQLSDLKGSVDQQADNQKTILQFLLTGQRPKIK